MVKDVTEWINTHQKEILAYRGKWVAIKADKGIISVGNSMSDVCKKVNKKFGRKEDPTYFLVPKREEKLIAL